MYSEPNVPRARTGVAGNISGTAVIQPTRYIEPPIWTTAPKMKRTSQLVCFVDRATVLMMTAPPNCSHSPGITKTRWTPSVGDRTQQRAQQQRGWDHAGQQDHDQQRTGDLIDEQWQGEVVHRLTDVVDDVASAEESEPRISPRRPLLRRLRRRGHPVLPRGARVDQNQAWMRRPRRGAGEVIVPNFHYIIAVDPVGAEISTTASDPKVRVAATVVHQGEALGNLGQALQHPDELTGAASEHADLAVVGNDQ